MIVKCTLTRTLTIVALITLTSCKMPGVKATSTESSADYLRKVMLELRDFNLPPLSPVTQRSTPSFFIDVDDKNYLAGKRHSSGKRIVQQSINEQDHLSAFRASMIQPVAKKMQPVMLDQMMAETATNDNMYYQIPGAVLPSSQIAPEVSSLTKAELNAVYKHAIEKGSAASLNALASVLRHRQMPKLTTTNHQIEIGEQSQPMYNYYFYPLKNFMNDVRQGNNHLLPAMNFIPENTGLMENSQKDIGNPLFMAISGFIGMAVLFMIGVLLLPRLGDFRSRVAANNDEKFLDITKTVGEAIDRHNCTDKQAPYISLDKRLRILCQPVIKPKPSSVVLLTRKSALQKEAKRRRKISKKCKIPPCKKNIERSGPT